jgi:polyhydroxybutyrate depolymerase
MPHLIFRTIFAALVALGCAPAQTDAPKAPGRYEEHITSGGLDRKFFLHVPPGYDGMKPIPVVVVLHGWTASAELAEIYTRMAEEGDANGFATAFPEGEGKPGWQGWNAGFINLSGTSSLDDVRFVSDVLDQVEKELSVDRKQEFVCGHSNGAFLANLIGSRLSNRLAAIGSVAGTIGVGGKDIPDPVSPVSVILFHGTADNMVAYAKGAHAMLTGVGAQDSAKWWADRDGCSPTPAISTSGNATITLYSGGKVGTQVELVSIANGSHNWPGGYRYGPDGKPALETATGVNAADLLWTFFRTHPKS